MALTHVVSLPELDKHAEVLNITPVADGRIRYLIKKE